MKRQRRSIIASALFLALLNPVRAQASAYGTVKSAQQFAIGGVGVTGVITAEELALRAIRDGPNAEEELRKLLREASSAGQMYALFGLRQIKVADYAALAEPYRQSSKPVRVISGCTIHTDPISEVVRWIDQWAEKVRAGNGPDRGQGNQSGFLRRL